MYDRRVDVRLAESLAETKARNRRTATKCAPRHLVSRIPLSVTLFDRWPSDAKAETIDVKYVSYED